MGKGTSGAGGGSAGVVTGAKNADGYVRFGDFSEGGSLNYRKLTARQREDLSDLLEPGEDPREAMERWKRNGDRTWKDADIDSLYEEGVSVFKAKNGVPIAENLTQAQSMAVRMDGRQMYEVDGKPQKNTGQDGEPVLNGITGKRELKYNKEKIEKNLISQMKKHYTDIQGDYDPSATDQIHTFWDDTKKKRTVSYKGYTFSGAKSKEWEDY